MMVIINVMIIDVSLTGYLYMHDMHVCAVVNQNHSCQRSRCQL